MPLDEEPLLASPSTVRKSIYPIQYPKLWDLYKRAESCIWTAEEIRFGQDLNDWDKMDEDTKKVVKTVLGFFAGADMLVNENIAGNLMQKVALPEARCFYGFQIMMENIHGETYSLMIENLVKDKEEKLVLLDSINTMQGISKLYDWANKWTLWTTDDEITDNFHEINNHNYPLEIAEIWAFAKRIVAFACFEGIVFSGMFAIIFWLKERGVLPGLTFSNELISRDEGLHRDFACLMFSMIKNRPPNSHVIRIVNEVVDHTKDLMSGCMTLLRGMNITDMHRYIEFVADKLLVALDIPREYNTNNPFDFMDKISFNGFANFFEKKVSDYGISGFEEGGNDPIELNEQY